MYNTIDFSGVIGYNIGGKILELFYRGDAEATSISIQEYYGAF